MKRAKLCEAKEADAEPEVQKQSAERVLHKYLSEEESLLELLIANELEELELSEAEGEVDVGLEKHRVVVVNELSDAVHCLDACRWRRLRRRGQKLAPNEHSQVDRAG